MNILKKYQPQKFFKRLLFPLLVIMAFGCSSLPTPKTEFRGVWVATVVNIDWPKNGNDQVAKQKADFINILNYYEDLNFNTVIVQVRTAGDAFYPSELAPWSRFLTGKEGEPKPGFENGLQWMIDQTHARGMHFHAWLNPYRATFDLDTTILASHHDFHQHQEWMVKYGKKYYYNPGIPDVWNHLTKIVEEVVLNYDVDGIHFDDYFYPYKISGEVFNDSIAFAEHGLSKQNLEDWRRSNVDSLVKNVNYTIKAQKPWVQFGISPFGVWKNKSTDPKGSDTKAGQTTYEDLYANPLLWMKNDWLDYIVPQAYWSMDYPAASHRKITEWWAEQNTSTQLFMGNGPYKIRNNADKAWDKKTELVKQLALSRSTTAVEGNVFFSAKSLPRHPDVARKIQRKFYKRPIQIPTNIQNEKRKVPQPVIISNTKIEKKQRICISYFDSIPAFLTVHKRKRKSDQPRKLLKKVYLPANESEHCFELENSSKKLEITIVDAYGNESQPIPLTN